ncbi:MAG: PilC/PilY family type IV pilus protein [Sterolibacterium sp.]|nr:PilC/PilY family type IV pilus protein [Sterolibacterium sp.]
MIAKELLHHAGRMLVSCAAMMTLGVNIQAATTDLASVPLVSSSASVVLPNLMFVLDDSGSMDWSYMPDTANDFGGAYGYSSSQCNGVYYDPTVTYTPPVDSTGASYANASFTGAWNDGYATGGGTTNLSSSFKARSSDTAAAAYYYAYSGTQTTAALRNYYSSSSTFYRECNSNIGSTPGSSVFTKVTISTAAEKQNFANWYSYYRTRMQMMKTAAGLAFKPIDNHYRVGFMTINNNVSPDFLNFATFDSAQKSAWYAKLYSASPNSSTPLREALSNAGRIYAGKLTSLYGVTVTDPIQYSCQQNFTILSTDGFWNGPSTYNLSGGSVGQQDGTEPRPYNDGAAVTVTVVTPVTTIVQNRTVTPTQTTTPWTRNNITAVSATMNCSTGGGGSGGGVSCLQDNGQNSASTIRTWCMSTSSNPGNSNDCTGQMGGGSPKAYACRGTSNSTNKPNAPGNTGCVTDGQGQEWCIYSGDQGAGRSCTRVYASNSLYACKWAAPNDGYTVTTQAQRYNQIATGSSTTSIDNTTSTYNRSVVTTNGVAAPPTNGATTTTVTNVSSSTTTATSDTGAPGGATTWTNVGSTTTSCSATPPALGPTAAMQGTPSTSSNGTAVVTPLSTTGPTDGTSTSTSATTGGTANTLADVAEYYYVTSLRTTALGNAIGVLGADVSKKANGDDAWQHMTTFTLGLGARGRMVFSPTYLTDTIGDFPAVKNGSAANPAGGVCSWQASGACNWPTPAADQPEAIDDLWHAAVNGRGTYFSATNPTSLATGLSNALTGVNKSIGTSAAAATSNPNVTSGDNFLFSSTFTTVEWYGELVRQQLDLTSGRPSDTIDWAARDQLDANTATARTIYTYDSTAASRLKSFLWASLSGTEQAYFNAPNISSLTQFCASGATCLSAANQTAAAGSPLVSFLRGDRSNEGATTDLTKYYRQRTHVLGDIVNAEAVYVKATLFAYADAGYGAFKSANSARQGMVYAAANDGMLHAFNADTGAEAWAYIPSLMLPTLYKLADKNYANQHQYFLDGTPAVGEISTGGVWKTILVGGMNGGGRGYYALDITDPAAPKALWEFADTNLGYTFGNPEIAKLADGTWVVMVASGYNNVSPGDGVGRLYVLNAATGAIIRSISTGVGSTGTPSGLARIRGWADNAMTDNTALRVYGGDLLGNVWRFDINNTVGAAGYDAQRLVTLVDGSGSPQPITAKPELGECNGYPVVFVGTGRYLGTSDLANAQQQSFYAVKDNLDATSLSNPRSAGSHFVLQTEANTTCPSGTSASICSTGQSVRTSSNNPVTFLSDNGWYLDFPDTRERDNTDPTLALGTLAFNTNIPSSSACSVGGYSFRYFLNYCTGAPISTAGTIVAVSLGDALATRPVIVSLPNNTVVELTRLSDGTTVTSNVPIGGDGTMRRVSWRELVNDQ